MFLQVAAVSARFGGPLGPANSRSIVRLSVEFHIEKRMRHKIIVWRVQTIGSQLFRWMDDGPGPWRRSSGSTSCVHHGLEPVSNDVSRKYLM